MTTIRLMDRCDQCSHPMPVAEMWRVDDVHGRGRHVCDVCKDAIQDEVVYEDHADKDLVGSCDCECCYRHRCRCAMREDEAELTGKHFDSVEQALDRMSAALTDDGMDVGF